MNYKNIIRLSAILMLGYALKPQNEELSAKSGVFSARKSHFRSSDDNLSASARIGYELPHGFNIGVSGLISGLQSKDEFDSELNGANFKLVEGHVVYRRLDFRAV